MANSGGGNGKRTVAPGQAGQRRWFFWAAGAGAVVAAVWGVLLLWPAGPGAVPEVRPGAPRAEAGATAGVERLVGRWVRPDGGYILEIRSAGPEGRLEAGYFNPQPINVARAEYQRKGEQIEVFVELRDINYPGSTYRLAYRAREDRLVGSYFQAVEQETYEVGFERLP